MKPIIITQRVDLVDSFDGFFDTCVRNMLLRRGRMLFIALLGRNMI